MYGSLGLPLCTSPSVACIAQSCNHIRQPLPFIGTREMLSFQLSHPETLRIRHLRQGLTYHFGRGRLSGPMVEAG